MSQKAVEVAQALLQELIEIVGEKPALAKRLVDAIEYRLVKSPLDPFIVYQLEGEEALRKKLSALAAEPLRVLIRQHDIPCSDLNKRKKGELVKIVLDYAENTDIGAQIKPAD